MQLWGALWRDEVGLVVSTELVLVGTVVVLAALTGVFLVRVAVAHMFMGVATDLAREQPFGFDEADTQANTNGGFFEDSNNNRLVGYARQTTPPTPGVMGNQSFDELFPGLIGDGQGELPVTLESRPAQHEGSK